MMFHKKAVDSGDFRSKKAENVLSESTLLDT